MLGKKRLFGIFLLLTLSFNLSAQSANEDDVWAEGWFAVSPLRLYYDYYPFTKNQIATARTRWRAIQNEIAQGSKNEWCGDYSLEGVEILHNTIIHWSPNQGFVVISEYSCQDSLTNVSFGSVSFSGKQLVLNPELRFAANNQHSHLQKFPDVFVPVKWGGAHYLIPEDKLALFCNDYVAGLGAYENDQDPDYFPVFIKHRERNRKRWALPIVPPQYSHLVKRPITTTVQAIGKPFFRDYDDRSDEVVLPIYLNAGARNGVRKGMEFRIGSLNWNETVKIVSVKAQSAMGEVAGLISDEAPRVWRKLDKDDRPNVKIGQIATTRPNWEAVDADQWLPVHAWQRR